MSDHQQSFLIFVYQPAEAIQVGKVQENVRLVQHKKVWRKQHFSHNLKQFVFAAADLRQSCFLQMTHLRHIKLFADIAFVIVAFHGLIYIQEFLILFEYGFHILSRCHFFTDRSNFLLVVCKTLAEILENSTLLRFIPYAELSCIPDSAVFVSDNLSVIKILVRVNEHVSQGGFTCTVASDKGAVLPRFNGK